MKKLLVVVMVFAFTYVHAQRRPALSDSLMSVKDSALLEQKLKELGNGTEQERMLLIDYYVKIKNAAKTDSVLQETIKKIPQGTLAFNKAMNAITAERHGEQKEILFNKIQQDFPVQIQNYFDFAYHSIAYGYANDKNVTRVVYYLKQIKSEAKRASAARIIAPIVMTYDMAAAESILRAEIDQVMKGGVSQQGHAPGEARPAYFEFLKLFSTLLLRSGKYEEAFKYIKDAYEGSDKRSDELTGNYAFLLNKNGKHQDALPLLEKVVREGKASQEQKNALKESYAALNPGKDATAHLFFIEQEMRTAAEKDVAKMLITENAPSFVVRDIAGKSVSLADFKGKTIVLDFWATWCGPCKKSFPAMQKAVDKYKKDPNVKFLFIHTWERGADPLADATAYLSGNGYRFDLYMDTKDPKTKDNPVVTAFKVRGIPAKFVIDGKGQIRFKVAGFSGGDDAAVAELSAMIEMAKKG